MSATGIGPVTGIHGALAGANAVILDSIEAFNGAKRGIERIIGEYEGIPGFRSIVGTQLGLELVVQLVPPYPQAIVEAVSELYSMGVRRVILIHRGYRVRRGLSQDLVLIARAAVPRDSSSSRLIEPGLPVLASSRLLGVASNILEVRFADFEYVVGISVTVDHPRLPWSHDEVERYIGVEGVYAVDSLTAPLYSLQYRYPRLEALSLVTLYSQYSSHLSPLEPSAEVYLKSVKQESRMESVLYLAAVEILNALAEGGE